MIMIWNHHKRATPVPRASTGPIIIPNDVEQARAVGALADRQKRQTETVSKRQQTWWERTVQPTIDELKARRDQNGFGQEFELSIMPKDRG